MMQAIWNDRVIAESDATVVVEGNHYFPPNSVRGEYLQESATTTHCGWKGDCNYYHLNVDGTVNKDAAWIYREPYPKAAKIKGHLAFWKGVVVREAALV